MKDEKETRKKLLDSARKEFSEKGYEKASLRDICKNAGVTTGALYFFFKDKDDLFVSLVKQPFSQVQEIMLAHYQEEKEIVWQGNLLRHEKSDDYEAAHQIMQVLYQFRDEFLLLLTKSQGTSVEHLVDDVVSVSEKHYRLMADAMEQKFHTKSVDDTMIHYLAHMQMDMFVYMITHIETEEQAERFMEQAIQYMLNGWYGMFGIEFPLSAQ